MAHQANHEENFNDKFQWNKSKVKTFTKTVNLLVRKKILTISQKKQNSKLLDQMAVIYSDICEIK